MPLTKCEPRFTRGPWERHEGVDYIVVMRGDETTDQGIRVDDVDDALLIDAAPDLFHALHAILAELCSCPSNISAPNWSAAVAAIVKATNLK